MPLTNTNKERNVFHLPFPLDAASGSSVHCLEERHFFVGDAKPLEYQPEHLPLVLVLRYVILGATGPTVSAKSEQLAWTPHINFHIFAESPKKKVPKGHANQLMDELQNLYSELKNHPIKFTSDVVKHYKKYVGASNIPSPYGFDKRESLPLATRQFPVCPSSSPPAPDLGGHPHTCAILVVIR